MRGANRHTKHGEEGATELVHPTTTTYPDSDKVAIWTGHPGV
jgi:hypothetical protein